MVTITCIMLNGGLMAVFGQYMPWCVFSEVFMLIGGSLMYTIDSDTTPARVYGYSVLMGMGAGLTQQEIHEAIAGTQSSIFRSGTHEVTAAAVAYHTGDGQSVYPCHCSWCSSVGAFFLHEKRKVVYKGCCWWPIENVCGTYIQAAARKTLPMIGDRNELHKTLNGSFVLKCHEN